MRTSPFFFRSLVAYVSIFLLVLTSCTGLGKSRGDEKNFSLAVQGFNSFVRWGEYKQASAWIMPQARSYYWELTDWLGSNVRILDFEVREVSVNEVSQTGMSTVHYRFFYKDDPYIRTKTIEQKWRFQESEKAWQVVQHNLESFVP